MNEGPVYTFAKWLVKEDQLESVLQLLAQLTTESIKEQGNLIYKVHQSHSDANTLLLYEGYKDQAALDAHRNSEHFQSLVIGKIAMMLETREIIITAQLSFE